MKKTIELQSTAGLHAALASKLVQAASNFDSQIWIEYKDKIVDAKSILGLMSLAIPSGQDVLIVAEGNEAEKAILDIAKLLG